MLSDSNSFDIIQTWVSGPGTTTCLINEVQFAPHTFVLFSEETKNWDV
jgi:hypothetical protein